MLQTVGRKFVIDDAWKNQRHRSHAALLEKLSNWLGQANRKPAALIHFHSTTVEKNDD
jgi:hypothetical protein